MNTNASDPINTAYGNKHILAVSSSPNQCIDTGKGSSPQLPSYNQLTENPGCVEISAQKESLIKTGTPDNKIAALNGYIGSGNCPAHHLTDTNVTTSDTSTHVPEDLSSTQTPTLTAPQDAEYTSSKTTSITCPNPALTKARQTTSTPLHFKATHNIAGFSAAAINQHAQRIAQLWPEVSPTVADTFPEFAKNYSKIKQENLPNFLGAKITVPSQLNLENWERMLEGYHDRDVCLFLRYGWPVGYEADVIPTSVKENHHSAQQHIGHVKNFITKELDHQAIIGPFNSSPFTPWTRVSPILTRPKKDSLDRRIIIDLSFPTGQAVNNGIDITAVLGRDSSYSLPSISDLTTIIQQHGRGSWLWKADLSRAYRQLRVDPLDCPLLGMKVENSFYVDLCPSFGCRSSSAACQRTSNALAYIMAKAGCTVLAYLDDYASSSPTFEKANSDYNSFLKITSELGLKLATEKCEPPTKTIEWLG